MHIHNVYCVGRNYRAHAAELGNEVPEQPMIFLKPTHALVELADQEIVLPGDRGEVHYEAELVIYIGSEYLPGKSVDELVGGMAVGLDFTLRDVQSELKRKGSPWLAAKGFLGAAPIGPIRPFEGVAAVSERDFSLQLNGVEVQRGNIAQMVFSLQEIVDFIGTHYGLGKGDLIYTGTPAGVGKTADGDKFALFWGEEPAGSCTVRLRR